MEYAKKNKDMLQNLSDDAKVRQCELCASMEQKMVAAEKMKEADARKPEECKPEPEDDKKAKKAAKKKAKAAKKANKAKKKKDKAARKAKKDKKGK